MTRRIHLRTLFSLPIICLSLSGVCRTSLAATFTLSNEQGDLLPLVMVTRYLASPPRANLADDGYAPNGVSNPTATTLTRFSDDQGRVNFADTPEAVRYRARAQGYVDLPFLGPGKTLVMKKMTAQQYTASYPSNVWLSQLTFGGDLRLKKTFQLNCAFCHQQASPFMRAERTRKQWLDIIERMNSYGARLPQADHQQVATLLQKEYRELRAHPQTVPEPHHWERHLEGIEMTEWPLGDGFSQMHDFLLYPNGHVFVGDNLQDRIYEINPSNNEYTVYKVPHDQDARLGGILGNRFKTFSKINNYTGVHSLAYSKRDGHIFITPSLQQALLEFDPRSREFTMHKMPGGFYPHTIRIDAQDRVWFTLALSSQVAMYDRKKDKFRLYDLPARGLKEWMIIKSLPMIFWFDPNNRPAPAPDREGSGLPMPYGIDIGPDGTVWVARLYANDIARIDPECGQVTMIDFPYNGPRRLRVDSDNTVWIVAFQDSLLVKYDPATGVFTPYKLPVLNEIPYALNIDLKRRVVWVNGNQSDTLLAFDIATESWKVYPLPRQRFFTRDVEISEQDGSVYTTNSHFPIWQSEGGTPTLLRISPATPANDSKPKQ